MKNSWIFPVIQAIHVVGLALSVGMIAVEDFTRLRARPAPDLSRHIHTGFLVMLATGLLLFLADSARYLANPAFQWKVVLLGAVFAAHFTCRRGIPGRFTAALSLALWTTVVLAARAIADFDR